MGYQPSHMGWEPSCVEYVALDKHVSQPWDLR